MSQEIEALIKMPDKWIYNGEEIDEVDTNKYKAFVYCITYTDTGKQYIGKKGLLHSKTRRVKGKKKKIKVESDWRDYYGSSHILSEEINKVGKNKFRREILYFCENKGMANYLEARTQMDMRVLENPDKFYNHNVFCRVHSSHIKKLIEEKDNNG